MATTKWKYEYRTILGEENIIKILNEWGDDVVQVKEVGRHEVLDKKAPNFLLSPVTKIVIEHSVLIKMPATKESKKVTEEDAELERSIILVVNRLNEVTGSSYTTTARGTRKHIAARLNEGRTVKDMFDVIESKNVEWGGGEMAQYLRPETLFGNKFESYLNYAVANKPKAPINKAMDGMVM